ncbi:hypothetical protein PoB_001741300 [Plakobranchus ocellatus]|uniref:Uncharacterized protein n=1 Tax=Plakobranchus ocellatus TaxID=259542 RepID=A0AAV3Z8Z1_9GAST|nr:hypothetical protein PoB_001741300 [Plakobranchus ocellatus]
MQTAMIHVTVTFHDMKRQRAQECVQLKTDNTLSRIDNSITKLKQKLMIYRLRQSTKQSSRGEFIPRILSPERLTSIKSVAMKQATISDRAQYSGASAATLQLVRYTSRSRQRLLCSTAL